MALDYVQSNTLYLSGSGTIAGATSVTLTTLADIYGNVLTMASFGSKGYITLEPDTTNEEGATFTGVTANANGTYTLTGVSTILAQSPYTETLGLVRQHSGGSKVVITDNVAFWSTFANKQNDETITGNWTFNTAPSSLASTPASTTVLGNVKLTTTPSTSLGNPTITIASPAVITLASHGLIAGDSVKFTTTGALPAGIVAGTNYFVIPGGLTTNAFEISLTVGGTAVVTTGTQSGTHTLLRTTPFAVGNEDSRLLTSAEQLGLANAPTTPSAANPFYTKTDVIAAGEPDYQAFTASGTWTKPAGLLGNELTVIQMWGGGGGGSTAGGGGGGGGGAFVEYTVPTSTLAATVSVTVGAAGAAAAQGGNSIFGAFTAYGGGGGNTAAGGGGGGGLGQGVGTVAGAPAIGGFGGGTGISGGAGVPSGYGGGGGGTTAGGASMYGGGGGSGAAGAGGASMYGGAGGANGSAGTAPGGGGGGGTTAALGARGEVRVWTIR